MSLNVNKEIIVESALIYLKKYFNINYEPIEIDYLKENEIKILSFYFDMPKIDDKGIPGELIELNNKFCDYIYRLGINKKIGFIEILDFSIFEEE